MSVRLLVRFLCFPLSLGTLHRSAIAARPGGSLVFALARGGPLPRNSGFCAFANGHSPLLQNFRVSADCSNGGGVCLEGFCNNGVAMPAFCRCCRLAAYCHKGCRRARGAVNGCSFATGLALSRWQGCRLLWRSVMSAAIDISTQEFAHARPFPASIVVRFQPASPG